jgi:hypothetical protein
MMAAPPAAPQVVIDYRTQKIADLPLFNGDKTDAISPEDFVRKTDSAKNAMRWDDATTATHFKSCLRAHALDWLKVAEFDDVNTDSWDILKPLFIKQWVKTFKEVSTLTSIASLVQGKDEHPREFNSRITKLFIDIKKARPQLNMNLPAVITPADVQQAVKVAMDHDMRHIIKCIFISGLIPEIRDKVYEKDPQNLPDAKEMADKQFQMMQTRASPKIHAVASEVDSHFQSYSEFSEEPEVKEAILAVERRRQGQNQGSGNYWRSTNNSFNNRNRQQDQNRGSQTPKFCQYCKKTNHNQEHCYKRLNKGDPFVSKDGRQMKTPGTHEFNLWKNELKAKGKAVHQVDDNSYESANARSAHLN